MDKHCAPTYAASCHWRVVPPGLGRQRYRLGFGRPTWGKRTFGTAWPSQLRAVVAEKKAPRQRTDFRGLSDYFYPVKIPLCKFPPPGARGKTWDKATPEPEFLLEPSREILFFQGSRPKVLGGKKKGRFGGPPPAPSPLPHHPLGFCFFAARKTVT